MPLNPLQHIAPPGHNEIVWRYLTPQKFTDLLQRSALFFPKVARLRKDDPLEGSVPLKEAEFRKKDAYRQFKFPLIGTKDYHQMQSNEQGTKDYHELVYPQMTVVSCWHMRSHESKPMWDRYANIDKSVAIRSTVGGLIRAFASTAMQVDFAPVRYLDFERDIWYSPEHYTVPAYNFMIPNITKSLEYEDERELRLLHRHDEWQYEKYWAAQENANGLFIPVNLNELVHAVVLAPQTTRRGENKIRHALRTAAVFAHLQRSSLERPPVY